MTADDRVSAALDELRPLLALYGPMFTAIGNPLGDGATRLLGAVDAVVALADQHESRGQSVPTWELRAVLERQLARPASRPLAFTVHAYPAPDIDSPMSCCGRTRHQVPGADRVALTAEGVTCRGAGPAWKDGDGG